MKRLFAVISGEAKPHESESDTDVEEAPSPGSSIERDGEFGVVQESKECETVMEAQATNIFAAARKGSSKRKRNPANGGCAKCRFAERGCKNCQGEAFLTRSELASVLGITTREWHAREKQRDTSEPILSWEAKLVKKREMGDVDFEEAEEEPSEEDEEGAA